MKNRPLNIDLPEELHEEILKFNNEKDLGRPSQASTNFYKAVQSKIRDSLLDYLANCKDACKRIQLDFQD